jgi:cytochrome c-type biogenesis protein CcmF
VARPAAAGAMPVLVVAYACLTHAFRGQRFFRGAGGQPFQLALPLVYRITAVWGNHEGSILLWSLILSGWTVAVSFFSRQLDDAHGGARARRDGAGQLRLFAVHAVHVQPVSTRMLPAPADGQDLNPLLQDPGMMIHPPMLYMGYVGFVVAFAFAVSALLSGRLDAAWARWSRPWTTVAWCFLTAGHCAGQLLGLLRAGLGRLVVLGPGGKRIVHALAGGHSAHAFAGRDRKARRLQDVDGAAWPSLRFRCRCWAPSSCARACSARSMRLPPTRRAACSS